MENMKSFFATTGLTSTSANHYCNLAKEATRKLQSKLNGVKFYSTDINIIGNPEREVISNGITSVENVYDTICKIGQLNSLIAFFREGIKEKERLEKEASSYEDTEAREEHQKEYNRILSTRPQRPELDYISKDDVLKTWSVGEQEKYLSLEAMSAVIGKAIHEDGVISNARIDLMNRISNPMAVSANGRDTIIYHYNQTVSLSDVDEMYFALQDYYRNYQAELNGMKKKLEDAVKEHNLKVDEDYRVAMQKFNSEISMSELKMQEIVARERVERQKRSAEVQKLKIAVPNKLKDTYEQLQKLG